MALVPLAVILAPPATGYTQENLSSDLEDGLAGYAPLAYPHEAAFLSDELHTVYNTPPTYAAPAMLANTWFEDFYNRIHVVPIRHDLGNLTSTQYKEVEVWNAWLVPRTLQSMVIESGDGITAAGPIEAPYTFAALESATWDLTISTDGPAVIDASITWDFDVGQGRLVITGNRIVPWAFQPDWTQGVDETLEWMTEITESENASEQATAMRIWPRRTLAFAVGAEGTPRQAMDSALAGWSGRVWSLPIWQDAQRLAAALPIGSTSLPVDIEGRDFHADGMVMLVGRNFRENEVVEIQSVGEGVLELKRPSTLAWPAGTTVYPARTARLSAGATMQRFTGGMHHGRLRFDVQGTNEWPELDSLPTYRGLPLLEDHPEWSQEPTMAYQRKESVRDNGYGIPEYTDRADVPMMRQAHRWSPYGRAKLARIRSLLYLLKGKWGAIWVPSWAEDFTLAIGATASNTSIDVNWTGYSLYSNALRGRRDIRITSPSGIQNLRITSAVQVDANTERLLLDAPIPADLLPETTRIEYLTLWRLDTDRLEVAWWSGDMGEDQAHADIPMPMRTFNHDL